MAQTTKTRAWRQTRREKTGAKESRQVIMAGGRVSTDQSSGKRWVRAHSAFPLPATWTKSRLGLVLLLRELLAEHGWPGYHIQGERQLAAHLGTGGLHEGAEELSGIAMHAERLKVGCVLAE